MDLLSLVAAVLIAGYAMVGGAFINAAITAPENTLRVLAWMWGTLLNTFAVSGGMAMVVGVILWFWWGSNPFLWLGSAHIVLFLLFYLSMRIARQLTQPEPPKQ